MRGVEKKFDYGKTHEQRYLALIDYVDANPYTLSVRKAASEFHLLEKDVERLWKLLALELIGKKDKNKRLEIEKIIEYDPKITASKLEYESGSSSYVVYSVASEIGHRFENTYTKKSYQRRKLKSLLTIQ